MRDAGAPGPNAPQFVRPFPAVAAKVTVFGESAGAMAIADLLASPLAEGLFRRAIVLTRGFRDLFGCSVAEALAERRLEQAGRMLLNHRQADLLGGLRSRLPEQCEPRPRLRPPLRPHAHRLPHRGACGGPLLWLREPERREVGDAPHAELRIVAAELWARRSLLGPLFLGQAGVVMADTATSIWAAPILQRDRGGVD